MIKKFILSFLVVVFVSSSVFANAIVDPRIVIANSLYNHWKKGNKTAALKIADKSAVKKLFKTSGKGANWAFQGCQSNTCSFSYEGGAAHFHLRRIGEKKVGMRVVTIYKVKRVEFVAD